MCRCELLIYNLLTQFQTANSSISHGVEHSEQMQDPLGYVLRSVMKTIPL